MPFRLPTRTGAASIVSVPPGDSIHPSFRTQPTSFSSRPPKVDPADLSLGSIKDKDGFGMGHLPLDLKMFATGLAAGILIDATIIRALLVPAVVSLFGRWNWILPSRPARLLRVEPSLPPRAVATQAKG